MEIQYQEDEGVANKKNLRYYILWLKHKHSTALFASLINILPFGSGKGSFFTISDGSILFFWFFFLDFL